MVVQKKKTRSGIKTWDLDVMAIRRKASLIAPWCVRQEELLNREISEMEQGWPLFLATIGNIYKSWGPLVTCKDCGSLLVFWEGLRCVECEREFDLKARDFTLGYTGQIPVLLGQFRSDRTDLRSRPFLNSVLKKINDMPDGRQKARYQSYFITTGAGEIYFAPFVRAYFPRNWNRSEPLIFFQPLYFEILGIPVDHIYPHNRMLCNFSTWHRMTLNQVLLNRVLPRINIDVMLADLQAAGCLARMLKDLGWVGLHRVYNMIGKPRYAERLKDLLRKYLGENYV